MVSKSPMMMRMREVMASDDDERRLKVRSEGRVSG
jgi:hypothetical protein